jgi:hypothetical protein
MSTAAADEARTAALKAARAKDSELKRARALATLEAMEASGASITFTAVANAAGVSTWLVYAHGIREHIDAARARQPHDGPAPCRCPPARTTPHRPVFDRPRYRPGSDQDAARRARQTPTTPPLAARRRNRSTRSSPPECTRR